MKKILIMFLLLTILFSISVNASLPLSGKYIVIDPGHGGVDPGTSYNQILEKDINLAISLKLKDELIKSGASVIMTREGDYDLSSPNAARRKKSDFDNRIKLINNSNSDIYLSIHINYLDDSKYSGAQVFYYGNENYDLANNIQMELNNISFARSVKKMPNIYMYRRLNVRGVLIECGFISNYLERQKLINKDYQLEISKSITLGIIKYFT